MLLAIDTATRTASLAFYDENGIIGETTWRTHENHTTSLMPQLTRLLQLSGLSIETVQAIAVATGPGSFTGLRIGLSLAKGLALARGIPLVGIPTLDGSAQSFAQQPLLIWPVLEIGRGRYVTAPYLAGRVYTQRDGDYTIGALELLAQSITARLESDSARVLVCGEVTAELRSTLHAHLPDRIQFANSASNLRRAAYLAELAWPRWQMHQVSDLETLTPFYIPTASLPQTTSL